MQVVSDELFNFLEEDPVVLECFEGQAGRGLGSHTIGLLLVMDLLFSELEYVPYK